MKKEEVLINLHETLVGDNKQRNQIEKLQLQYLEMVLCELANEYRDSGVRIDISVLQNIRKKDWQWIITSDGKIIQQRSEERNKWFDSKSFDAIIPITVKGTPYAIFCVMKGVQNSGGHQDGTKKEIGLYVKAIEKNANDNYHFMFMLDGEYINKDVDMLGESNKYNTTTTGNVKETLKKFINSKL